MGYGNMATWFYLFYVKRVKATRKMSAKQDAIFDEETFSKKNMKLIL